jgi:hypothetical protein
MQNGKLLESGPIDNIIDRYLQTNEYARAVFDIPEPEIKGLGHAYQVCIEDNNGKALKEVPVGSDWRVRICFKLYKPVEHFIIGLGILTNMDQSIQTSWSEPKDLPIGDYEVVFMNYGVILTTGVYKLVIGLSSHVRTFQYIDNVVSVIISDAGDAAKDSRIINTQSGLILNPMEIKINKIS